MARKKGGRCIRKATYLDRYGRPITRCAKFSGSTKGSSLSGRKKTSGRRRSSSLFGLGQADILKDAKPILITGGLAAAGAWASQSISSKLRGMLNVQPGSMTDNLLVLATGIVLGGVVGKVLKKRDYGIALGVGAVAVTALNFIGTLTPGTTAGLRGGRMGVLTSEPAPYYKPAATPPIAQFPAGASVSNLYSDAGVAAVV